MARSWEAVRRVADRHESRIRHIVVTAAESGQAALDEGAVVLGLERGIPSIVESALMTAQSTMITVLSAEMPTEIEATLNEAGQATAKMARFEGGVLRAAKVTRPIDNLRFDLTNVESVRWINTRSGELIRNISRTNLLAIRKILARSFTEGIPIDQVARLIRPLIGLTDAHAEAVLNFYRAVRDNPGRKIWAGRRPTRVPKGGASPEFLRRRSTEYANRLLNYRARLIARTEAVAASNQGQLQLWRQAIQQNLLREDATKEWIVTPDERLCSVCESLNGEVRHVDEPFSVGAASPPAHALCRCSMGISRKQRPSSLPPFVSAPPILTRPAA